jgi:hypothetical protein
MVIVHPIGGGMIESESHSNRRSTPTQQAFAESIRQAALGKGREHHAD